MFQHKRHRAPYVIAHNSVGWTDQSLGQQRRMAPINSHSALIGPRSLQFGE